MDRFLEQLTFFVLAMYQNNVFGRKSYITAMVLEHSVIGIILLLTSYPREGYEDYINLKNTSITESLSRANHTIIFGLILLAGMFTMLMLVLRLLLSTDASEKAKETSLSKQLISVYIGLTRTIISYPIAIYIAAAIINLFDQDIKGTASYYVILFTLLPILFVYVLSLIVAFKMTQMPVQTSKYFWNCIYAKNLYIREAMKIVVMLSDCFLPTLRQNKFSIIAYFLIVCAIYAYLNFSRCFFYDLQIDRVQMYFETVIENFKDDIKLKEQKENLLSELQSEEVVLTQKDQRNQEEDLFGSEATVNLQNQSYSQSGQILNQNDQSVDVNMIEFDLSSPQMPSSQQKLQLQQNLRKNLRSLKSNPQLIGEEFTIEEDLSYPSLLMLENCQMNFPMKSGHLKQSQDKIDNFTFAFDNNHVAAGLNLDDFFKDASALELANKKFYDVNNSQQQSARTILEIQQMKFESDKHARKFFFIWLMEEIFKQYEGTQNQNASSRNIEFELLYINFINQNLNKHFLAIFQLLRIHEQKQNLKFFDRLLFSVSEQIMLNEAITNFKNYFGGFDYNLFIDSYQQAIELDNNYEKTTGEILEFWSKFKGKEVLIQPIIDLGVKISKRINLIKRVTKRQEDTYAVRKDLGKYQLYAMFHLNMLYDPSTFNTMAQYLKNSLVFKTRKFLGQDHGITEDSKAQVQQEMMDDKGICIAEGWNNAGQKGNIRFLFANKTFCDIFKTTPQLVAGQYVVQIMPDEINYMHGDLIHRFYTENRPTILGNLRIQIAKTFDGYLIPVKMRVNFYYHPQFKYSFFTQFERVTSMNMFNEEQTKISCDDCIFVIADEKMGIKEYSENLLTILGISKHRLNMFIENNGEPLKLTDIIVELQSAMQKEFGDTVLPEGSDVSLVNKMVRCKKYQMEEGQFSEIDLFPCIITYTQQPLQSSFCSSRLNIFMIIPLNRHPDYDGLMSSNQMGTRLGYNSQMVKKSLVTSQENQEKNDDLQHLIESLSSDDISGIKSILSKSSASSGTSTNSTGFGSAFFAKNLLFQNSAPKVIKINLALIVAMIVAFFVINIYNLAIFLNKHSFIKGRFDTYSYISQRNARLRAALLDLKMIHQISQNQILYDSSYYSSIIEPGSSRLQFYQSDLLFNLDQVRENADRFNQFIMANQEYYSFDLQFDNITFITELGRLYAQNVSYKHSINLFNAYANEVKLEEFIKQKPLLNVESYLQGSLNQQTNSSTTTKSSESIVNRPLTKLEQNLFFLFENGLVKMSQLGQRQSYMLSNISTKQTDEGIEMLNISTFVSIGIVTLIGIIIFPLVSKVIERQYSVIRFFNYLDVEAIDAILAQGNTFQKQLQLKIGKVQNEVDEDLDNNNSGGNTPVNSDDEKTGKVEIKLTKNQLSQLESSQNNKTQNKNAKSVFTQGERKKKYQKFEQLKLSSASKNSKQQDQKKRKAQNLKLNKDIFENMDYDSNDEQDKKPPQTKKNRRDSMDEDVKQPQQEGKKKNRQDQNIQDKKNGKKKEESDEDRESSQNDRSGKNGDHNKRKDRKRQNSKTNQQHKNLHKNEEENKVQDTNEDQNKNKQIAAQIQKLSVQKRFKICMLIGILILYLNSSLLISFYQSQIVFTNDKDSAMRMSKFYQREECAYNLLLFMREKIIKNSTLNIDIYLDESNIINTPAVTYYIDRCYQNEYDIQTIRKNMPEYLMESQAEFEGIEGSQLCDLTFNRYLNDPVKAQKCKTALDSILQKGLGNTMYYIIGYIQQMNFNHDSPLSQNKQFLNSLLNQQKYHELADFILFYLADSFDFLQQIVIYSGEIYFNQAKQNFMLAFGLFMSVTVILTIFIGTVAYKKTKKSVLDIQNMLVLIPLDKILPEQRQKIEKYLNK
eukprot:403355164